MKNNKKRLLQFLSFLYPVTIKTYDSDVSGKLELTYEYGKLVVNTETANYSFGSLHRVFQAVLKRFSFISKQGNALILGFGAGSIAKILQDEYKLELELDGVELDPVMLEIYKDYFVPSTTKHVTLFQENALDFIQDCETTYDYILIDVFENLEVPETLLNESFIEQILKLSHAKTQIAMNTMLTPKHPFVQLWKTKFGESSDCKSYDVSNLVLFQLP